MAAPYGPALGRCRLVARPKRPALPHTAASRPRCLHQWRPRWQQDQRQRSRQNMGDALRNTKVQWYPIPVGLGVGFLGFVHFYRKQTRDNDRPDRDGFDDEPAPKKRPRVRPDGPWQVQLMSTLPLKAVSRLWGSFNEINIPYYLRVPGFKLYSYIFGVNLDEVAEPDLHVYPNLAAFFYRRLKPGVRPLDPDSNSLLSPSDGKVLQFGKVEGGDIEQVKGMTYSIDALLGKDDGNDTDRRAGSAGPRTPAADYVARTDVRGDEELVAQDEEFARVNGISYTIPSLISGKADESHDGPRIEDQSAVPSSPGAVSAVSADLARGGGPKKPQQPWWETLLGSGERKTALYYAVVYLAPGDYHRYHSPANWVVERRRHFAGELYSVSPYLQRTLPGLFTLNERVVLLGRWRWGFFSFIPVGATNVGSIVLDFDAELRTNSLLTDTAADRAAAAAAARGEPYSGYAEAHYGQASRVLGGHALRRGDEMGGFKLGSTVVLVFEAPAPTSGGGGANDQQQQQQDPAKSRGFTWAVERGQTVKMGQALGYIQE